MSDQGDYIEDNLNAVDAELHNRLKNDHFEYDIDLNDEHSHAVAAQVALLEKRDKKLIDQMEELEERLFDSGEASAATKRKLALVEREVNDFKSLLLQQREADHAKLIKELDQLKQKVSDKVSARTSVEAERRDLEHKIAILQSEAEQNERAQVKAENASDEAERLRTRIAEIIDQKAVKAAQLIELDKKKVDLEQKLKEATVRNKETNIKTVADLEKIIDAERKRGQQAIDYVKRELNAKLRFLQLQLDEGKENSNNYSKDKRTLDKELKSATRELEDEQAIATSLLLRIETLERTINKVEEETDRDLIRKDFLDTQNYSFKREKDTLRAQLDAALFVNEKLNAEIPKSSKVGDQQGTSEGDSKVQQAKNYKDAAK
jgi:chromosome segregation ATPase